MTSFSLVPLQVISLIGMAVSLVSFAFVVLLVLRRLFVGPEVEGVFTLFGIVFFILGILLFAVGVLGEYIGRIYTHVRQRPRYLVSAILEDIPEADRDAKK
jgi:undecaprenyl-phosphate 4-deoxy-4-formamido-L-arabinose transferase